MQVFVGDALAHRSRAARIESRLGRRSCPLTLLAIPFGHVAFPLFIGGLLFGFQKLRVKFSSGLCCVRTQIWSRVVLQSKLGRPIVDQLAKSRLSLLLGAHLTQPAQRSWVVTLVGGQRRQIASSHPVSGRVFQGSFEITVRVAKLALQQVGVTHITEQVRFARIRAERGQVVPFRLLVLLRLIANPREHVVRVEVRRVKVEGLAKEELRVRQPTGQQLLIAAR